MPKTYDPATERDVVARALPCLGGTVQAAWERAGCVAFEFGRDTTSGRGVTLVSSCDDLCPTYANLGVVFSVEIPSEECQCLGFRNVMTGGWGAYVGCAPAVHASDPPTLVPGKDFIVRTVRADHARHDEYRLDGISRRARELGLENNLVVSAIDGAPVNRANVVERTLAGLPARLPRSVLVLDDGGGRSKARARTISFVTRAAALALARALGDARFSEILRGHDPCLHGSTWVSVDFQSVSYDPKCHGQTVNRLERVANTIRTVARGAAARAAESEGNERAERCRELPSLPSKVALWENDELTELRYVDWMAWL
ncbi:MAG TPA: hypothetical protein VHE30_27210 [Polyangiaceae bacterium]|nr:hypothetical protein [Polyangiaceae bacterium]